MAGACKVCGKSTRSLAQHFVTLLNSVRAERETPVVNEVAKRQIIQVQRI
jgi:hypothetical protein